MNAAPTATRGKEALHRLAAHLRASLRAWRASPQPRRRRRFDNYLLLCLLLKDLGWVLLCGVIAWPAALAALYWQTIDVLHQWHFVPVSECVHGLATLAWLLGNSMWMTAQLLFEPDIHSSRTSPWYSGALFLPSANAYLYGRSLMQAIHMGTLIGLAVFYLAYFRGRCLPKFTAESDGAASSAGLPPTGELLRQRKALLEHRDETNEDSNSEALVFGVLSPEVYSKIFIVPWILKDLLWSRQHFIPAMICMLLVTILMADYLWLFKKWRNLATLLWTTGTAVWICNDLVMHEQEVWPWLLSILFFGIGACMLGAAIVTSPTDSKPRQMAPEYDPLM